MRVAGAVRCHAQGVGLVEIREDLPMLLSEMLDCTPVIFYVYMYLWVNNYGSCTMRDGDGDSSVLSRRIIRECYYFFHRDNMGGIPYELFSFGHPI